MDSNGIFQHEAGTSENGRLTPGRYGAYSSVPGYLHVDRAHELLDDSRVFVEDDTGIASSPRAHHEFALFPNEYQFSHSDTRRRATSLNSIFRNGARSSVHNPSVDPFIAWDDSAFEHYHVPFAVDDDASYERSIEELRVAIRRTEPSINTYTASDDSTQRSSSSQHTSTRSSSPSEKERSFFGASDRTVSHGGEGVSDTGSEERITVPDRFQQPVEFFRQMDEMRSKIYDNSLFSKYTDGRKHESFNGRMKFEITFTERASYELTQWAEILKFCDDVTKTANKYGSHGSLDRVFVQLIHLIEFRNVLSRVWESIRIMKDSHYCADFISLLVLEPARRNVARLVPIECSTVEQLTMEFDICLHQIVSDSPEMVLTGNIATYARNITASCTQVLTKLGLNPGNAELENLWRCAVHVLDMAVVSYSEAHTQSLGPGSVTAVSLPGRFFETQYYMFRRRAFSCLGNFLGGQEAWVLENFGAWLRDIPKSFPDADKIAVAPPLYLATDAITFADIWGPMWKTSMIDNEQIITQYNVGSGMIIPWKSPSPDAIQMRKGEVFCHWSANDQEQEIECRDVSTTFLENDILLIGAPIELLPNAMCKVDQVEIKDRLRIKESMTGMGTERPRWVKDTRTVTAQIQPPYTALGFQQGHKLKEGRFLIDSFVEQWKNSPKNRSVKDLELRLGLEMSVCTYHARRVRVIELFQTDSMWNYLQISISQWKDLDQRRSVKHALASDDYKAFGNLYELHPDWRTELGELISCGLDMLQRTGKMENGTLELFWVPKVNEPGICVTLDKNDITWIGFLEQTRSSGVMAVLNDRCLEFPRITKTTSEKVSGRIKGRPVLQTSLHINGTCLPDSLQGRLCDNESRKPEYKWYWSLEDVKDGDLFHFGALGSLKTISLLGVHRGPHRDAHPSSHRHDQVLAEWCGTPELQTGIRQTFRNIGKRFDGRSPSSQHHEVEQYSTGKDSNTEPVKFHIVSAKRRSLPHSHTPSLSQRRRHQNHRAADDIPLYQFCTPRVKIHTKKFGSNIPVTDEAEDDLYGVVD